MNGQPASELPQVVVIGDLHGCSDLLRRLLQQIERQWQWHEMVFLGDYIDRGPDPKGVIDELVALKRRYPGRITCLMGNHEQWLLQWLNQPGSSSWLIGMEGLGTIHCYNKQLASQIQFAVKTLGIELFISGGKILKPLCEQFFQQTLPRSHFEFFTTLAPYYQIPGLICAHAGVKPGVLMTDQRPEDLCWISDEFYQNYAGEDWVIFGHMCTYQLRPDGQHLPFIGLNRIVGVDTGSEHTGVISAYRWPDGAVLQARKA